MIAVIGTETFSNPSHWAVPGIGPRSFGFVLPLPQRKQYVESLLFLSSDPHEGKNSASARESTKAPG